MQTLSLVSTFAVKIPVALIHNSTDGVAMQPQDMAGNQYEEEKKQP